MVDGVEGSGQVKQAERGNVPDFLFTFHTPCNECCDVFLFFAVYQMIREFSVV